MSAISSGVTLALLLSAVTPLCSGNEPRRLYDDDDARVPSWIVAGALRKVSLSWSGSLSAAPLPVAATHLQLFRRSVLVGATSEHLNWKAAPDAGSVHGHVHVAEGTSGLWRFESSHSLLARYGSSAVTYIANRTTASGCNLVCLAGGGAADANYTILSDVVCSSDGGTTWTLAPSLPFPLFGASATQVVDSVVLVGGVAAGGGIDIKIPLINGTVDAASCSITGWQFMEDLQDSIPGGPRVGMLTTWASDRAALLIGGGWKVNNKGSRPILASSWLPGYRDLWSSTLEMQGATVSSSGGKAIDVEWHTHWVQLTSMLPFRYAAKPFMGSAALWELDIQRKDKWGSLGTAFDQVRDSANTPQGFSLKAPLLLRENGMHWASFDGTFWYLIAEYGFGSAFGADQEPIAQHPPNATHPTLLLTAVQLDDDDSQLPGADTTGGGTGPGAGYHSILTYDEDGYPILVSTNASKTYKAHFSPCTLDEFSCAADQWLGCSVSPFHGGCHRCSVCGAGQVTLKPCSEYQDAVCGPNVTAGATPTATPSPSTRTLTASASAAPSHGPQVTKSPTASHTRSATPTPLPVPSSGPGSPCTNATLLESEHEICHEGQVYSRNVRLFNPNGNGGSGPSGPGSLFDSTSNAGLTAAFGVAVGVLVLSASFCIGRSISRGYRKLADTDGGIDGKSSSSAAPVELAASAALVVNPVSPRAPNHSFESTKGASASLLIAVGRIISSASPQRIALAHAVVLWMLLHATFATQMLSAPPSAQLQATGWVFTSLATLAALLPVVLAAVIQRASKVVMHGLAAASTPVKGWRHLSKAAAARQQSHQNAAPGKRRGAQDDSFFNFMRAIAAIALMDERVAPMRRIADAMTLQVLLAFTPLAITAAVGSQVVDASGGWSLPGIACCLWDVTMVLRGSARLAARHIQLRGKAAAKVKAVHDSSCLSDADSDRNHAELPPCAIVLNPLSLARSNNANVGTGSSSSGAQNALPPASLAVSDPSFDAVAPPIAAVFTAHPHYEILSGPASIRALFDSGAERSSSPNQRVAMPPVALQSFPRMNAAHHPDRVAGSAPPSASSTAIALSFPHTSPPPPPSMPGASTARVPRFAPLFASNPLDRMGPGGGASFAMNDSLSSSLSSSGTHELSNQRLTDPLRVQPQHFASADGENPDHNVVSSPRRHRGGLGTGAASDRSSSSCDLDADSGPCSDVVTDSGAESDGGGAGRHEHNDALSDATGDGSPLADLEADGASGFEPRPASQVHLSGGRGTWP